MVPSWFTTLVMLPPGRASDGDGILAEFPSVLSAVECAVVIQRVMTQRNADVEEIRRMRFRIGHQPW